MLNKSQAYNIYFFLYLPSPNWPPEYDDFRFLDAGVFCQIIVYVACILKYGLLGGLPFVDPVTRVLNCKHIYG
jgi:hypothetical protein